MVEKIQNLLRNKGLNQAQLEPLVGLPRGRISKWAGGQGEPTARQALRMARHLGVAVEFLIDDTLDRPPLTPVNDLEKRVWEVIQTIGPEEAWRRLLGGVINPEGQRFHATGQLVSREPESSSNRSAG